MTTGRINQVTVVTPALGPACDAREGRRGAVATGERAAKVGGPGGAARGGKVAAGAPRAILLPTLGSPGPRRPRGARRPRGRRRSEAWRPIVEAPAAKGAQAVRPSAPSPSGWSPVTHYVGWPSASYPQSPPSSGGGPRTPAATRARAPAPPPAEAGGGAGPRYGAPAAACLPRPQAYKGRCGRARRALRLRCPPRRRPHRNPRSVAPLKEAARRGRDL